MEHNEKQNKRWPTKREKERERRMPNIKPASAAAAMRRHTKGIRLLPPPRPPPPQLAAMGVICFPFSSSFLLHRARQNQHGEVRRWELKSHA